MEPLDLSDLQPLRERLRTTWTAGDFGVIARTMVPEAEIFMERLGIQAEDTVLDVACGTGNLTIPAARMGAVVTGVDIAPNLLEQASARAKEEGLTAKFIEGDAEALSFADASFDWVVTMAGAMFALRPERVAAELLRVCKPGGTIAMANWTRGGFVGRMFGIGVGFAPPPAGVPVPILWGDEEIVRERLGAGCKTLTMTKREAIFELPMTPAQVVELFLKYFGPSHLLYQRLEADKKAQYAAALRKQWADANEASDGGTKIRAEYLDVIGVRAG